VLKRLARLKRRVVPRRGRPEEAPASSAQGADLDELLHLARLSFLRMQVAWDAGDLPTLATLTTEPLLEDLRSQLLERGPALNRTEVLSLDARLLAIEELHEAYVASVEFSGVIREQLDAGAAPFRELWLLANLKATGRGWRLARVQSLS
jgi:predicted lipid-binding transport protein (Tim44 family)